MRHLAAALVIAFVVAGCGEDENTDLKQFVKDSDHLPFQHIRPLPEVRPYVPFTYQASNLIDPFSPRKIEPPKGTGSGGGLHPDFNRRREPLEAYPLENLKMVGTLERKKAFYAVIKTPDNNLFRVKVGNYMGQNFGRILAITETSIKLREIVPDGTGGWEEKDQTLQLQEEPGAKK